MKATIYPAEDGWRWHIQGLNNEILASGEPYISRSDAEDVVRMLFGSTATIEVIIRDHGGEKVLDHYQLGRQRREED